MFCLRNKRNGRFVQVLGDGSESLVTEMGSATMFPDATSAHDAFHEHEEWVGPLEIVELELKRKP